MGVWPGAIAAWGTARPAVVAIVVLLAVAAGLLPLVIPGTFFECDAGVLAAAVIFAASYVALAVGRVPGLAIDARGRAFSQRNKGIRVQRCM